MSQTGITLTDRAANHVKDFLAKSDDGLGLRVGIKPAGCSGSQYVIETATEISDQDHTFESNGVKVIIDDKSLRYLSGTELDFVQEGLKSNFRFNNPHVKDACGCGESFSLKEDIEE